MTKSKAWFVKSSLVFLALLSGCQEAVQTELAEKERGNQPSKPEAKEALFPVCAGNVKGEKLCHVSAASLAVLAPRIEGRMIQVTGYLVIDGGMLSLYPSEQDYLLGTNTQSLRIRAREEVQRSAFSKYGYSYVKMIGKYSSIDEDAIRSGRAGSLYLVSSEPVKIRENRETEQDLRVDIDDLE